MQLNDITVMHNMQIMDSSTQDTQYTTYPENKTYYLTRVKGKLKTCQEETKSNFHKLYGVKDLSMKIIIGKEILTFQKHG